MLRRFGLVYTIFSLFVLVALAALVLARLGSARSANMEEAEASFRRLRAELVEQADEARLPDALREYASLVPVVRSLVLFDPDRGLRYVWTAEADILAITRSELARFRGFPSYRLRDASQIRLRDEVDANLYLDAVYRILAFQDAYPPLRDSLIALLIFAFITVLVALGVGRASAGGEAPGEAPAPATEPAAPPESHDQSSAGGEETDYAFEEIPLDEIATGAGEPGSLFNPITGLSHNDHLERRLGLELERAAYNDQDLACLVIRFPSSDDQATYVERAKQILATFQFEDLCFEYDDAAFCVVLPNTELPQALRQAESFRNRHPECRIGLSARNGRLVEARRLLTETERSLERAAGEAGGIVGFRPDPKKYRQFVTRQASGDE